MKADGGVIARQICRVSQAVLGGGPRLARVWGGCAQGRDAMRGTATLSEAEDAWTVVPFRWSVTGEWRGDGACGTVWDKPGSGVEGGKERVADGVCRCESEVWR